MPGEDQPTVQWFVDIDLERCIGCSLCERWCPWDAIEMVATPTIAQHVAEKGGPLILGAAGCLLGGWLTDTYIRRTGGRKWGRRVFGMLGHGICVPLYLYCLIAPSAWTFALALGLTGFFNDLAMGSAWATCQDIGRRHAAIVAGCMNTIGNLGGAVSSWVIGDLILRSREGYLTAHGIAADGFAKLPLAEKAAAHLSGYEWNFITFAVMYAGAVLLWLCIDATKPVFREDAA